MSSFVRSLVVVGAFGAAFSFASCSSDGIAQDAMAAAKKPQRSGPPVVRLSKEALRHNPLATVAAGPGALRSTFRAPAHVEFDADAEAAVTSAVGGRVVELRARVGDAVEKGAVLFVLESRELGEAQRELLVQRSTEAALAPVVALAEQTYARAKALFEESQGIARSEVVRRESEWRQQEAQWRAAGANARAAADRLRLLGESEAAVQRLVETGELDPRRELRAPIAGVVMERLAVLGASVDSGVVVARLADPTRLVVVAAVPEAAAARARTGLEAHVRLSQGEGEERDAVVRSVLPSLGERTRTLEARLAFVEPAGGFCAGAFAEVEFFEPAKAEHAVVVPRDAVHQVDRRSVVFVPNAAAEGEFEVRPVEVGEAVDGRVEVKRGLRAGELVVTDGSFVLKAQAVQGPQGEVE